MIIEGFLGGTIGTKISNKLSLKGVDKVYIILVVIVIFISMYNFIGCLEKM